MYEKIKEIVEETNLDDEQKYQLILRELAKDYDAVHQIISVIQNNLLLQKELVRELNHEVSRYHIHINDSKLLKKNKDFLNKQTEKMYEDYKKYISPCYNNFIK